MGLVIITLMDRLFPFLRVLACGLGCASIPCLRSLSKIGSRMLRVSQWSWFMLSRVIIQSLFVSSIVLVL